MTYSPATFDVVVVPFPYSDRLAEKRRPALVISSDLLHREGFIWIAMITSSTKVLRPGDVPIADLAAANLPGASVIRTAKIATIEPDRVLRRIGTIAAGERQRVKKALVAFVG